MYPGVSCGSRVTGLPSLIIWFMRMVSDSVGPQPQGHSSSGTEAATAGFCARTAVVGSRASIAVPSNAEQTVFSFMFLLLWVWRPTP
jgi:hypothetical protein